MNILSFQDLKYQESSCLLVHEAQTILGGCDLDAWDPFRYFNDCKSIFIFFFIFIFFYFFVYFCLILQTYSLIDLILG